MNSRFRNNLIQFLLLSFIAASAGALDHCVTPTGSGQQDGSDWANAFAGIPSTLVRGDTYWLASGTYPPFVFDTIEDGTKLITIQKATADHHGPSAGWTSSLADGQARFEVACVEGWSGCKGWWLKRGYIHFDGTVGSGGDESAYGFAFNRDTSGTFNEKFIFISRLNTAEFRGLEITHTAITCSGLKPDATVDNPAMSEMGISGSQTLQYDTRFANNYFDNCQVAIYTAGTNTLIENNYFDRAWSGSDAIPGQVGLHGIPVQDSYSVGTIFRNNTMRECTYICFETQNSAIGYGNVFDFRKTGTQGIFSGTANMPVLDTKIYNNTIASGFMPILYDNQGTGNEIRNNLFFNAPRPIPPVDQSNNVFITSDVFVNQSGGDYRLKTPVGCGQVLPPPINMDRLGHLRGADGCFDVGAYEYVDPSSVVAPVIPTQPQPAAQSSEVDGWRPFDPTIKPNQERLTVEFHANSPGEIRFLVFDRYGHEVTRWTTTSSGTGDAETNWDGKNRAGKPVASGFYLLKMEINGHTYSKKIAVLR